MIWAIKNVSGQVGYSFGEFPNEFEFDKVVESCESSEGITV